MPRVQAPNGQIVEFPEGTSPDVMSRAMQQAFPSPARQDAQQAMDRREAAGQSTLGRAVTAGAMPFGLGNVWNALNADQQRAVSQGETYGFGDELSGLKAGAATGLKNLIGQGPGYSAKDAYNARVEEERARKDQFAKAHPVQSFVSEAGGAIFNPANLVGGGYVGGATTTGGLAGRLALMGGAEGALGGVGNGTNARSRALGAALGGGAGAVAAPLAGVVAPAAAKVVGGGARKLASAISPKMVPKVNVGAPPMPPSAPPPVSAPPAPPVASPVDPMALGPMPGAAPVVAPPVAPSVAQAATKPARLAAAVKAAEVSPRATVDAADANGAYARVIKALQQQGMTPAQAIAEAQELGPMGMLADTGLPMRDLGRAVVNRGTAGGADAIKALDYRQLGQLADGEFTAPPSSIRIAETAADKLGVGGKNYHAEVDSLTASQKAASGPAYAKAYEAPPVDVGEFRDFASSPLFKQAYDRARKISEIEFVKMPDGSEQIIPLPQSHTAQPLDWRTLDLMKQGLDDMIYVGKGQGPEGIGANEQGAIKAYKSKLLSKLDTINPDYKAAREAYSGPAALKDAMEEGLSFMKDDAATIAKKMAEMTPSEQQAYRLGGAKSVKNLVGDKDITSDAGRAAGGLKPNQLERFQALFPDKKAYAEFANTLAAEKTMFDTRASAIGNSTTAKQLAAAAEQGEGALGGIVQGAVDVGTGGKSALLRWAAKQMGKATMPEGTADALSAILYNMDETAMPGILKGLTDAQRRKVLADAVRSGIGSGAAESGANAGSQTFLGGQ